MYYCYRSIDYHYIYIYKWNDWDNIYVDLFIISNGCSSYIFEKGV